jgi:enamine deaminase RidA (YjgF/YER057c/UK114 family)
MRRSLWAAVTIAAAIACAHPSTRPSTASAVFPEATAGETPKLAFHVAAATTTGSIADQTRRALEDVLSRDRDARIVRLRVFAVGQPRLDTVQRLIGEILTAHHVALPAISVVGVQSLPRSGQLVAMESIASRAVVVNPSGLAFLAGFALASGERTAGGLATVARTTGVSLANVTRVSCFYESTDQAEGAERAMRDTFPSAEVVVVQSYGSSARPAVECEAVGRLSEPVPASEYVNLPGSPPSPNYSRAARVSAPRLVFTGTLQALGDSASDMRALMERARDVLSPLGAHLQDVVMADNFWLTAVARDALRLARNEAYGTTVPAATGVFMTSLASPRGTVALELIVPER